MTNVSVSRGTTSGRPVDSDAGVRSGESEVPRGRPVPVPASRTPTVIHMC